ncbi:MAG: DUF6249 domain-containing protein [Bacteroidales bacterium]|jgi:Flp pilus assembly protein TadB|nr:DUF6249 domain-containing protein [Bacteroidales bacterium]
MKKIILSIASAFAVFAIGLTSLASLYAQTSETSQTAQSIKTAQVTETQAQTTDSASNYSQLTADQIYSLEMEKLRMKNNNSTSVEDVAVPLIVFLFPVAIIFLVLFYAAKDKKRKYALIEKAIETGQPLPELNIKKKEKNAFYYLTNGIIFTFLGTGILVIHFAKMGPLPGFLFVFTGGFFLCFGLAFLLIGFIKRRMEKRENAKNNEEI